MRYIHKANNITSWLRGPRSRRSPPGSCGSGAPLREQVHHLQRFRRLVRESPGQGISHMPRPIAEKGHPALTNLANTFMRVTPPFLGFDSRGTIHSDVRVYHRLHISLVSTMLGIILLRLGSSRRSAYRSSTPWDAWCCSSCPLACWGAGRALAHAQPLLPGGGAEAIAGGVGVEAFSGARADAGGGGCDKPWHAAGKTAGCWPAFGSTASHIACEHS